MNRIMRPPFFKSNEQNVENKQVENKQVENRQLDDKPTIPFIPKETTTKETTQEVKVDNTSIFQTISIKCENSITIKYRDNYYKFSLAEEKVIPENRRDVVLTNTELNTIREDLTNSINQHLDNQIQELLNSLE